MRRLQLITLALFLSVGCGSSPEGGSSGSGDDSTSGAEGGGDATEQTSSGGAGGSDSDEFQLNSSNDADQAHGEHASEIEATRTHAAMRLFVVDPNTGPLEGIVIKMTDPNGRVYYTGNTDSLGYAEVLVPAGQRYEIEYLALGRRSTTAQVNVPEGPNQDIRLTMRHRRRRGRAVPPAPDAPEQPADAPAPEGFVLDGVLFESGAATIEEESFPRLDRVVEYMTHRDGVQIIIAGHTDNVGNPRRNQALSEARAQAVRQYLIDHGIDGERMEAIGFGDEQPVASNDTEEGRAQNRRIEAVQL